MWIARFDLASLLAVGGALGSNILLPPDSARDAHGLGSRTDWVRLVRGLLTSDFKGLNDGSCITGVAWIDGLCGVGITFSLYTNL